MLHYISILCALIASMGFTLQENPVPMSEDSIQENPVPMSEDSIKSGRTIYGRFCRSCHGRNADGRGTAAVPGSNPANLADDEWDYGSSDAEIFKVIKEGIPPDYFMDSWDGKITDDDIWNTINFLRDFANQ